MASVTSSEQLLIKIATNVINKNTKRLLTKIAIMRNFFTCFFVLAFVFVGCSDDQENQGDNPRSSSLQANPAPDPRDCDSTSAIVGESRNLRVSDLYGISGVVTIISDCEIEITDFFYNGSGPNISVYAGVDGDYRGGVNMSEPLNGTRFEGETLNLFLPEGASFDEFNSISIWCFEFDVDFSSASFR